MRNLITVPLWLAGDHVESIVRVLLGPLSDPRGWSDSMGSPGCRLMLAGLLGVLAAAVAWGRGGPPEGVVKKLGRLLMRTASPPHAQRGSFSKRNSEVKAND
jgi:hypothetical protein